MPEGETQPTQTPASAQPEPPIAEAELEQVAGRGDHGATITDGIDSMIRTVESLFT